MKIFQYNILKYIIIILIIIIIYFNFSKTKYDIITTDKKIKILQLNDLNNDIKYFKNKIRILNNYKNDYLDNGLSKQELNKKLHSIDLIINSYKIDIYNLQKNI